MALAITSSSELIDASSPSEPSLPQGALCTVLHGAPDEFAAIAGSWITVRPHVGW